jgi:hypothetical protein
MDEFFYHNANQTFNLIQSERLGIDNHPAFAALRCIVIFNIHNDSELS